MKHKILLASLATLSLGAPAFAAVTQTLGNSSVQANYDSQISNTDLINQGSANVLSVSTTGSVSTYPGDVAPFNNFNHLYDGGASTKVTNNDLSRNTYFDPGAFGTNPTITFQFNTTANPAGYSLTSIQSISGWADSRTFANQVYNISYSTVSAPTTFISLASVNYKPFADNSGGGSSDVLLTDTTGILATNVSALKFSFIDNGGGAGQVFREIDVFGASVPEPTSIALAVMSCVGLLRRRRA